MTKNVLTMAWELLARRERIMAGVMCAIAVAGAGAQVVMIGSVMPFLAVLSNPGMIETNRYMAMAYHAFGFESRYDFVVWLGVATILVIFLGNGVMILRQYAIHRFTLRRVHSISVRLTRSYLRREYEFFLGRNSGDISKRILSEAEAISSSFILPATELVAASLSVIAILAFLVFIDPVVTLAGAGLVVLVYGSLYALLAERLRRIGRDSLDANQERFASIGDTIGGIKDIKVLGKESAFSDRFEAASRRSADLGISRNILSDLPRFGIQAIFFGGIVLVCLLVTDPVAFDTEGSSLVDAIPTLGAFALAAQRLLPEAQKIYRSLAHVASGGASVKSVHEDTIPGEAGDAASGEPLEIGRDVRLNGVSYRYPGASVESLGSIDLTIPRGRRVGVAGGTGSGKSTLADICLGLFGPTRGEFRVDGRAVEGEAERALWRSRVGYVPQEIFLTDGTFAENIAFGVDPRDVDEERVEECARAARLHDVIMDNRDGYHARVGDRGVRLSGGQRQRIGIARALYRRAEFLVMDEATSALDNETEEEVIAAIDGLPDGMTVVMIAHRLTTLRGCDEIVVLDRGEVVEHGAWDDLIARGGRFSKLARSSGA